MDLKSVETKYNPLCRIQIGTPLEISQAYDVAKEIVSPFAFRAEVREFMVAILATVALHAIYAHCQKESSLMYPTLEDVVVLLRHQIIEEEDCDEDGNPQTVVRIKSVRDVFQAIVDYHHVPYEDIYIPCSSPVSQHDSRLFSHLDLKELYSEDIAWLECCPYSHPWICKNFMQFAENESPDFLTALEMSPMVLDEYMIANPECRYHYMLEEAKQDEKTETTPLEEKNGFLNRFIKNKKGGK